MVREMAWSALLERCQADEVVMEVVARPWMLLTGAQHQQHRTTQSARFHFFTFFFTGSSSAGGGGGAGSGASGGLRLLL